MKGYRTIILGALASVLPIIEVLALVMDLPEWRGIVPAEYWPHYAIGVAFLKILMRFITTSPVGNK